MFEYLYLGRVFHFIEENPKESIRAIAATAIVTVLSSHYTERKKSDNEAKAAAHRLAAARLELELAELKLKQTPDM